MAGYLNKATALLHDIGGRGWTIQADLSEPSGASRLWAEAETAAGHIYGLINNAGIRSEARVEDDLDIWQAGWTRDLRINLQAPVDLCRAAVTHFRRHDGGRIINIASRAAQRGYTADYMPYGASKAALINVSKSLARNHGPEGIVTVVIAPGFVRTRMADDYVSRHGLEAAVGDIPIGDMVEPTEVADLAVFCLRPDQRSLNGATLDINGASYVDSDRRTEESSSPTADSLLAGVIDREAGVISRLPEASDALNCCCRPHSCAGS